jgi:hypothetical protein
MELRKHIERSQIETLFQRLQRLRERMPDTIEAAESPNFILRFGEGGVGLEVTRSVSQEYVRGMKLHDSQYPAEWVITTNLTDKSRRRSNDEITAEMLNSGEDAPWKSCEQEMADWRDKIARSLSAKRERLNQPTFQKYSKNWLLIYDQPGLPNDTFTHERAPRYLDGLFAAPSKHDLDFDSIFLLSRRYLFRRRENKLLWHYDKAAI